MNIGNGIVVSLIYSSNCRTVYGQMTIPTEEPPPGSNCYVKVVRTSDQQTYRASLGDHDAPSWLAWTQTLFDKDVRSYAWGYCQWGAGGRIYKGGTSPY